MDSNILIFPGDSLKVALKKLNETAEKTLIVVNENKKLIGTLTDGDVRRYIIKTGNLEGLVEDFYNKNPIFIFKSSINNKEKLKSIFLNNKIELLPVVDYEYKVVDYITWSEIFTESGREKKQLDIPVVIMAGGKGTRLKPFTKIFPKPLIPVGDKTMIEHIINSFREFGIKNFYVIINYKGELIETYFKNIEKNYNIEFIWEEEFLGTAGSLYLLKNKLNSDFIVSNCDILLDVDYSEVFEFHKKNKAYFTSITSIQHFSIPYGVVHVSNGGKVKDIKEKPEYTFQINTGVYILNPNVLDYIPENKHIDMPQLIRALIEDNKKVLAYPINEGDYIDMGQWKEYKLALEKLSLE